MKNAQTAGTERGREAGLCVDARLCYVFVLFNAGRVIFQYVASLLGFHTNSTKCEREKSDE